MSRIRHSLSFAVAVGTLAASMPLARAVPYASGVRNTSGANWEFVLNEPADNVTVRRNGANPLNLGALTAGRHSFSLTGFSTFDVDVSNSAPVAWAPISDPTNLFTNYTIPSGVAINTNPSSPFFGTVYVANSLASATERGRQMGDGIYALTADMKGVDLANNFAVVTDPNDVSQAKAPGFTVDPSSASPWRLSLDAAGNVIVADWSDPAGGIKYAAPNLATGGLILADEFGEPGVAVHGSIASKVYVTGSVGNNLTVAAMDEDLSPFNSVWRWDVGAGTSSTNPPTALIDSNALAGLSTWIQTVNGVRAGAHFSPQTGKWYLVQNRNDGNQAGILVVQPDGVDGFSPTILWDSLVFSNDPNGDLDPADAIDGATSELLEGIQDVFRNIGDVTVSADGTKLLVHRINPAHADSPLPTGAISIIPLDSNGVPDLDVAGGAITNLQTIATEGDALGHSSGAQLEFDAAGNLYVANSGVVAGNIEASAQLVQVFSPGGNTKATTSSTGTFAVVPLVVANTADFDSDGDIDGADFLTWQRGFGAAGDRADGDADGDLFVDADDLAIWRTQFSGKPATAAAAAVPEPTGLIAVLLAALAPLTARRSRLATAPQGLQAA